MEIVDIANEENTITSNVYTPAVSNCSEDSRNTIIQACNNIDININQIKFNAMNIGYHIHIIRNELNNISKSHRLNVKDELTLILKNRFDRGLAWGYRMMSIYQSFQKDDPIIDLCTTSQLIEMANLHKRGVDISGLKQKILNGEKITISEISEVEKFISQNDITNVIYTESQTQLVDLESQLKQSKLLNERKEREVSAALQDLREKEQKNEQLIQQLREKQDSERNIVIENQNIHDSLTSTIQSLKDEMAKVKATPQKTIDVEVIPEGFTSIQEAIASKSEELKLKEIELANIEAELQKSKSVIEDKEEANKVFMELHSDFVSSSVKVLEAINKINSTHIKSNKMVIQNIVTILNDLQLNLSKQISE